MKLFALLTLVCAGLVLGGCATYQGGAADEFEAMHGPVDQKDYEYYPYSIPPRPIPPP